MAMNKVKVTTDNTDHLGFFCEKCNNYLETIRLETEPISDEKNDNVTHIHLNCSECDFQTHIKFYWTGGKTRFL